MAGREQPCPNRIFLETGFGYGLSILGVGLFRLIYFPGIYSPTEEGKIQRKVFSMSTWRERYDPMRALWLQPSVTTIGFVRWSFLFGLFNCIFLPVTGYESTVGNLLAAGFTGYTLAITAPKRARRLSAFHTFAFIGVIEYMSNDPVAFFQTFKYRLRTAGIMARDFFMTSSQTPRDVVDTFVAPTPSPQSNSSWQRMLTKYATAGDDGLDRSQLAMLTPQEIMKESNNRNRMVINDPEPYLRKKPTPFDRIVATPPPIPEALWAGRQRLRRPRQPIDRDDGSLD
eukprot:TRINITY_DN17891_c0_g1_i1.p1 TRINITY_DN17891_c0_g1~~TRINITY_DN17891_c0_g1_i1.p1  ORF type:complete len:285 (-),score=51.37 TRINITY_DN17891_c0_g1_i1:122-976(-)